MMRTKLDFLSSANLCCFGQGYRKLGIFPDEVFSRYSDSSQTTFDAIINRLYAKEHYQERCLSMPKPTCNGSLKFGWWNVGLAYGSNISDAQYKELIVSKVIDLIGDIDVLGMGEFASEEVLCEIRELLPLNYRIMNLYEDSNQRLSFDTVVIYNGNSLMLDKNIDEDKCNMFAGDGAVITGQYRIAQKVRFFCKPLDSAFDIYFVHWSRHDGGYESARKRKAGSYIHQDVFGRHGEDVKNAVAILMGDFNAEPSEQVFSDISVSRSRTYAEKHGGFFNPFWRRMHDDNWTINCGNRAELRVDKCLFDYIMVSSPFLRLPKFRCIERIYGDRFYVPPRAEHRPVSLKISWEKEVA